MPLRHECWLPAALLSTASQRARKDGCLGGLVARVEAGGEAVGQAGGLGQGDAPQARTRLLRWE